MKVLDIAEVSKRSGLQPSALRYYEEIGLIVSVGRHGLRRQYGPQTLLQLSLIAMGRSAGFTLAQIAGMFGHDGQADLPRDDLHARADQLDRQIREMTVLRNALRHVAECPAPSHMECETFQRLLKVTSARRSQDRKKPGKSVR